jgi:hypothetical protein
MGKMKDITETILFDTNKDTYTHAMKHYNGDFKKEFDLYAEFYHFDSFPNFDLYFIRVYVPMIHTPIQQQKEKELDNLEGRIE